MVKKLLNWILRPFGLATTSISIDTRVDDKKSGALGTQWEGLHAGGGPLDRLYIDIRQDQLDALEAWRKSFLIRQIVRLTTAYVVGDKIKVSSPVPEVEEFLQEFWNHPENTMDRRLPAWSDELTRNGELFPILFTNKITGMSQVRITPSIQIIELTTNTQDYEKELFYFEQKVSLTGGIGDTKRWKSKRTAKVHALPRRPDPMMLHYTVNLVVGATRGEGDLRPVLPWALRYSEWLKDRVKYNRLRTRLAGVDIEVANDGDVRAKQLQYQANPPTEGAVTVHGPGEKITYPAANIQGWDAEPDGRAQRLAVAAGSNFPIHYFGEGSSSTRSTADKMDDPTHRHLRIRQNDFKAIVIDFCQHAWSRFEQVRNLDPVDPQIKAEVPEVSRADNRDLADAAKTVVEAFVLMKEQGWVDDEVATRLSFKFAGEILDEDVIQRILDQEVDNGDEMTALATAEERERRRRQREVREKERKRQKEEERQAEKLGLKQRPRDGQTVCKKRCHCRLRFVELDEEWHVFWELQDTSSEHCPDCKQLAADWNPLVIIKKQKK